MFESLSKVDNGADAERLIIASEAMMMLANTENRISKRRELRRKAILICSEGWTRLPAPHLAVALANRVVDHFHDRYAREEPLLLKRAILGALKAIDSSCKTTQHDGSLFALLLCQKSSLLRCRAQISVGKEKTNFFQEQLRCISLAAQKAGYNQAVLIEQGQALWALARQETNQIERAQLLNRAERSLRDAAVTNNPIAELVLCRFLRLTHRPYQAVRRFLTYSSTESNLWRISLESHLIGESALHLSLQGFDKNICKLAASHARSYLYSAIHSEIATARTYVALANVLAILDMRSEADNYLSKFTSATGNWVDMIEEIMRQVKQNEPLAISAALGFDEAAVWNQLGSYALRFKNDVSLARQYYETGASLDNRSPELLTNIAKTYLIEDPTSAENITIASDYIERAKDAAIQQDRTWRWWRPVRKQILDARARLSMPPLPDTDKYSHDLEQKLAAAEQNIGTVPDLLNMLIAISTGIELHENRLSRMDGLSCRLDFSPTDDGFALRSSAGRSLNISFEDLREVIDGKIGLSSLIDRKICFWPEYNLPDAG